MSHMNGLVKKYARGRGRLLPPFLGYLQEAPVRFEIVAFSIEQPYKFFFKLCTLRFANAGLQYQLTAHLVSLSGSIDNRKI